MVGDLKIMYQYVTLKVQTKCDLLPIVNDIQYVTIWNESAYKWTINIPQDKYHFR